MQLEPRRYGCREHRSRANTDAITAAVERSLAASGTPTALGGRSAGTVYDESVDRLGLTWSTPLRPVTRRFDITVACPGLAPPGTAAHAARPAAPHDVVARGSYTFVPGDWDPRYTIRPDDGPPPEEGP